MKVKDAKRELQSYDDDAEIYDDGFNLLSHIKPDEDTEGNECVVFEFKGY